MDKNKIKLGIAPIGWTNDDLPELGKENSFEQCISEMALAGYSGCEVGNKYPHDEAVLKPYLDDRGLVICNAWFSTFLTTKSYEENEKDFIKHCSFIKACGAKVVGVAEQGNSIQGKEISIFDCKPVFTPSEWDLVLSGLERLAQVALSMGMKLCYHHHMGTGIQTAEEIDHLMKGAPSVGLLYDTGHLVFCGEDYLGVLAKHIDRVVHVHLKDIRKLVLVQAKQEKWSFLKAVKEGVFTVPGDGCINFDPVFEMLDKSGYTGWMVVEAEQDPAKANPFRYAKKARAFINEKTGL